MSGREKARERQSTSLTLCEERGLAGLVLRHLVHDVLLALLARAERVHLFGNLHLGTQIRSQRTGRRRTRR